MADFGKPATWQTWTPSDATGTPIIIGAFQPVRSIAAGATTVRLTTSSTATVAPVAMPATVATSYRARVPAASAAPVHFVLSTNNTTAAILPTTYTAAGTGGTPGDKGVDPGVSVIIGLSAAQQTALAAGTLYLSAISSAGSEIQISFGNGSG